MYCKVLFIGIALFGFGGCGISKKSTDPIDGNIVIKEAFTTTEIPGTKNKKTKYTLSFLFEELSTEIQMDSVLYNNKMFVLSHSKNEASAKINKVLYGTKEKSVTAKLYYTQNKRVYFKKVVRIKNLEPLYMP